jgi:ribonuclease HII
MSMAKGSELPLSEVRRRLREAADAASHAYWLAALRTDVRAGARALARGLEKRIAADAVEAARLDGLFALRRTLRAAGAWRVAGVDEVGVGPLAGPVVAAAVVLPDDARLPGLDDSKRLDARTRERLAAQIRAQAIAISVSAIEPAEIDRLNVYHAALRAMQCAVLALEEPPDHVLVDARTIPGVDMPQTAIVHGDALDASIAAASIVAKVHRDALMRRQGAVHPGYGFERNAGYPTPEHLAALRRLGPSPIHRRSFAPVAASLEAR